MNTVTTRVWAVLFASTILLGSFIVTANARAITTPTLIIEPQTQTASSTTYAIILINHDDVFNVVEFELTFASSTTIEIGSIESPLCRPELTVANILSTSTSTGSWYVACGTFIPFSDTRATLAVFTIPHTSLPSTLDFSSRTSLYRHDGLGTQVIPNTIGITPTVL